MLAHLGNLMATLQDCRDRYAALVNRLSAGSAIEDADVELEYQRLYSEWEDGDPEGHDVDSPSTSLRIQFREALQPVPPLLMEVQQELVIRSVRSLRDADVLRAYRHLTFNQESKECIRSAPSQTLRGLDAVILLLQSSAHLEETVPHPHECPTEEAQDRCLVDTWPPDQATRRVLGDELRRITKHCGHS